MYSGEELAKLIQFNTLSKAIKSIDRMNEALRKSSVISLKTPETTLKAIESIQKSIDSFKCENMFPNLMTLSKSLDHLKSSYSSVSSSPNQEETVSDEACDLANGIVDRIETHPVFNNCTFNINVPERSNNWTRSEIFTLIGVILTLVFGVINVYQNIDKENSSKPKDSTSQVDTSISDLDSILANTSKLIQSTTDNIDTIPDASRYF